jgi:hypothetical protein
MARQNFVKIYHTKFGRNRSGSFNSVTCLWTEGHVETVRWLKFVFLKAFKNVLKDFIQQLETKRYFELLILYPK